MESSILRISKALLDLASASDVVLHSTPKGAAALNGTKLAIAERSLMKGIDGFRALEQVLAMSRDLIGVHGALGKLMASRYVTSAKHHVVEAVPPIDMTPVTDQASANIAVTVEPGELENAKRLLIEEAKHALGAGAAKLRPRIEACRSIEEIYDLIVKVQEHLKTTGKADPDVFLDRLTAALASARKPSSAGKRPPAKSQLSADHFSTSARLEFTGLPCRVMPAHQVIGLTVLANVGRLRCPVACSCAYARHISVSLLHAAPTSASEPAVVCILSAVAILSFSRIAMPCSGPRGPCALRSRSRAAAIPSASGFSSMTELMRGAT